MKSGLSFVATCRWLDLICWSLDERSEISVLGRRLFILGWRIWSLTSQTRRSTFKKLMADLRLDSAETAIDSFQEFNHLQGRPKAGVGIRTEGQRGDGRIFNEDCGQAFLKDLGRNSKDPRSITRWDGWMLRLRASCWCCFNCFQKFGRPQGRLKMDINIVPRSWRLERTMDSLIRIIAIPSGGSSNLYC